MNAPRTLIIGLDGATFDLIKPWAQAGHLPALERLMAEGVHAPLQAWPNMNSAVAWTSMVTGYNPGQHGIYDFGDAPPQRDYTWHPTTAVDRRKEPFWRILSESGQQVGIINVPISYPADPVNGFMLSGMDTPGVHSPGFAHPPDLQDELRRQGIDYAIDVPNLRVLSKRNPHRLPWSVQRMVDARSRTILHLMQTRPWDMLMAVFVATDRTQHNFWPHSHISIESHDWTPIRSLYQQIDSFFSDVLEIIDENTTVLVVSDHGFGPVRFAKRYLNQFFAQLGLLRYRQGGSRLQGKLLKTLLLYGRRIIPQRFQLPPLQSLPGLRLRAISEHRYSGIEWSKTQVFAAPHGEQAFVNLQGRQPEGTVSPEEYHPLCERVQDILLNLTDPATGLRVVRGVRRREDIYHGPYLEKAADLLIEWDDEVVQDALCYRVGENEPVIIKEPKSSGPGKSWLGTHWPQGIFIAHGPHIKRGTTVMNATLYDIAPTILYLQGRPIPVDMDGKVLTDIFTAEQLRHHPVQHCEPASVEAQVDAKVLDAKEARKIEERLRDLGYIE
ncbi:alkaline phosphatase family protein [bacterium]|nr:alkaline phosphatase family protein [bacterium]